MVVEVVGRDVDNDMVDERVVGEDVLGGGVEEGGEVGTSKRESIGK